MEYRRISADAVPRAIEKARRYRLLNEPRQAESICRDVLEVDADNQDALRMLVLSLTDQFTASVRPRVQEARDLLPKLEGEYTQQYYGGVIAERRAKAMLEGGEASEAAVFDLLNKAMRHYDAASKLADADNPDATLRWNTCVRIIDRYRLGGDRYARSAIEVENFDNEMPPR